MLPFDRCYIQGEVEGDLKVVIWDRGEATKKWGQFFMGGVDP